ncbi:Secreted protein containing C-terminal beta-propeller domain [Caloramator quimbayensis]|uniref:Secreted protein containing C-terminal beta-propeller domain n=1 Tax=Caloramator quimbayensis TaxID=1147123 RepID=A0A1T4WWT1_9CLOT|nr:beta-propeller domain-containing protein [Caloramator quimbayensis]SKA81607.1 Secreted protein containing C-terminal beta-propeller domain [Caloramator quimbayensis]
MKKRLVLPLVIVLLISSFNVYNNAFGLSKNCSVRVLPSIKNAPFNKELIVMFDYPLDEKTVGSNVYVLNYKNSKVPINISLTDDKKSIKVSPVSGYEFGKTYTLFISNKVRYKNGKYTNTMVKRQFTISQDLESKELPIVKSNEELLSLLSNTQKYFDGIYYLKKSDMNTQDSSASLEVSSSNNDYSKTNVQVEGVDEGDIIKTDGNFIYEASNNKVYIVKAYPAIDMSVESVISFDEKYSPMEVYIDGNYLTIIGTSYIDAPVLKDNTKFIMPPRYINNSTVKTFVYNIADRKNPKLEREYEIEGSIVSTRKIGNIVYVISNKYQYYYDIQNDYPITPLYKDSAIDGKYKNMELNKVRYFPEFIKPSFLNISGIDIKDSKKPVQISSYLGAGQEVYSSNNNLYIAVSHYKTLKDNKESIMQSDTVNTIFYKFGFKEGKAVFISKAEVPGTVLNQFSMDEYNGFFRAATTSGQIWRGDENTSKSNVYVFDDMMNLKGKIEGIAPKEKIYSVRFMGDRAYVVTFRNVDPLFVIDLKNPVKPNILGELKISGYSNYIHPYDENNIIGFGMETTEIEHKDEKGNIIGTSVINLGMKMAVFDVSDVKNPKAVFIQKIGDRGTYSQLLYDHKALLFSKEKGIIAFPVTLMETKEGSEVSSYGKFSFQGAYVYDFNLSNGFKLKGKITHLNDEDYLKAGDYWYNSSKNINRILYIGNNLYTISESMIKVNNLSDLKEIKSLDIK